MKSKEWKQARKEWNKVSNKRLPNQFDKNLLTFIALIFLSIIAVYTTIVPIITKYLYSGTYTVIIKDAFGTHSVRWDMSYFSRHEAYFYTLQAISLVWCSYVWYIWLSRKQLNIFVMIFTIMNIGYFIYWIMNYNDIRTQILNFTNNSTILNMPTTLKNYIDDFWIYTGLFITICSFAALTTLAAKIMK